jgi:hypothetical protein
MKLEKSAMPATLRKDKTPSNKKRKGKTSPQVDIKKESTCFFY